MEFLFRYAQQLILFALGVLVLVLVIVPYFIVWGSIRDTFIRNSMPNTVWLIEENQFIVAHELWGEKGIEPEFPLVRTAEYEGDLKNYYAKFNSLKKAEDWLLAHGYKIAEFTPEGVNNECEFEKKFPMKVRRGKIPSIINVVVDYGDGDYHMLSYRYKNTDNPLNFKRFNEVKDVESYLFNFPLPWLSTDGTLQYSWDHPHNVANDFNRRNDQLDNIPIKVFY